MDENEKQRLWRLLKSLFESRELAVLATQDGEQPYTSLVAFAVDDTLKTLIFITNRNTRKYRNILKNKRVSMMIHNSSEPVDSFSKPVAVTAIGEASDAAGPVIKEFQNLFISKHSALKSFTQKPSSVIISIHVKSYIIVEKFENVSILEVQG